MIEWVNLSSVAGLASLEAISVPMTSLLAFAEAGAPPAWAQFVPILLIFAVFYFVVMAPMRKRQKALDDMIAALKKGDKVITNGGIHGEVSKVDDDVLHLKVADNVRLKVSRSAVSALAGPGKEGA